MPTNPAVNVVRLSSFPQFPTILAMDHTSIHWNCLTENIFNEIRAVRMSHGRDSAIRKSQVDGLSKVQRNGGGITEIYGYTGMIIDSPRTSKQNRREVRDRKAHMGIELRQEKS